MSLVINVPIDIDGLMKTESVMLVAPMRHPIKGTGWVALPVTRELLINLCPVLLEIVDEGVSYYENDGPMLGVTHGH